MKNLSVNEIRKSFLEFFESKGHYVEKSYSLIPEDDPSILLIGAGMAPLKKYFMGIEKPPRNRMATVQKCIRIGDIENVGTTSRHLTFFEMLGNFSFGDYFKKESLEWGMEYLLDVLEMPIDRLWVTVYEEDDESYELWKNELNFPQERIVKLGKEDNFWEIGLGPCGPCSEIYFDRGEKYGCGDPNCKPGCECDRYVEFWNHVFTQFNKNEDGSYTPLKNKNIDTGMGLERLAAILQEKENVFEIDQMHIILDAIEKNYSTTYKNGSKAEKRAMRILTDHMRSISFMISDGVIISNEGRGYVLKKLIRRCVVQKKRLKNDQASLTTIAEAVIDIYGEFYTDLLERKDYILDIIAQEEKRFEETLSRGLNEFDRLIDGKIISGEDAFMLYDTYGFPLELTVELAEENNVQVDSDGFYKQMEIQRERARKAGANAKKAWNPKLMAALSTLDATSFTGYDQLDDRSKLVAIISNDELVNTIDHGFATLVFDHTPFYATSGGQNTDTGFFDGAKILDVHKKGDLFLHEVEVYNPIEIGKEYELHVDRDRRRDIMRNHSATHLLHQALIDVLGEGVSQAGSDVNEDRLRFDFTYNAPLTEKEIKQVEDIVNKYILEDLPVTKQILPIDKARELGAKAMFSEKYGEEVRVVSMGDFSIEFCGGTHVDYTGMIGTFIIASEKAVASGIRRIEAFTGRKSVQRLDQLLELEKSLQVLLHTQKDQIFATVEKILEDQKVLEQEISDLKSASNYDKLDEIKRNTREILGINVYYKVFDDLSTDDLKEISDSILSEDDQAFTFFITKNQQKIAMISASSDAAIQKGFHSGNLIRVIAKHLGGGGGGRPNFASAGAKNMELLSTLDDTFFDLIQDHI